MSRVKVINEGLSSLQIIGITASKQKLDDVLIETSKIIQDIGQLCLQKKISSIAMKTADMVIKLMPNDVDSWIYRGEISVSLGKRSNAISAYEQANKINETSETYDKLSQLYKEMKFYDKANEAALKSQVIDKDKEDEQYVSDMIDGL